jgi:hypothetical protein
LLFRLYSLILYQPEDRVSQVIRYTCSSQLCNGFVPCMSASYIHKIVEKRRTNDL